jgi:mannose-6-phosphate isomerase
MDALSHEYTSLLAISLTQCYGTTLVVPVQKGINRDERNLEEVIIMETDHRPWGYYEVLADENDHKVKRIIVYPGKRLSLQRHRRRSEHWFILYGRAVVAIDLEELELEAGQSVDIPLGAAHRILNAGDENLAFIEIQTGEYFGEDDIERLQDDYGRA